MSLLLSEGHSEARRYPIGMVWSEARFVRERLSNRRIRDAAISQLLLGTLFNGKKAAKELKTLLEKAAESD